MSSDGNRISFFTSLDNFFRVTVSERRIILWLIHTAYSTKVINNYYYMSNDKDTVNIAAGTGRITVTTKL